MKKLITNSKKCLICLIMCLICLSGCKTIEKIVEVPVIHTEYVSKMDTTFVHDSIWMQQQVKNDTVFMFKDRYHEVYKFKYDTICRIDSVTVVQEVPVVTNELSAGQATQITLFWVLLGLIVLLTGVRIYIKVRYGK